MKVELEIPTVQEVVAQFPARIAEIVSQRSKDGSFTLEQWAAGQHKYGIESQLEAALCLGDNAGADKIMASHNLKPSSPPNPDAENWHAENPLIYYACWGNNAPLHADYNVVMYDYLVKQEPECVFAKASGNKNLLQACLYAVPNLTIMADLLERGLSPLDKDDEGKSAYDEVNKLISERKTKSQNTMSLEIIKAMFDQAIAKQKAGIWTKRVEAASATQIRL